MAEKDNAGCWKRTGHCSIYPPDVGEECNFRKLNGKFGRFYHLVFEDLGALARVEQRVNIEVAKIDPRFSRRQVVHESLFLVGENVEEEVVLYIFAC